MQKLYTGEFSSKKVIKLINPLYDLKQTGAAWQKEIKKNTYKAKLSPTDFEQYDIPLLENKNRYRLIR